MARALCAAITAALVLALAGLPAVVPSPAGTAEAAAKRCKKGFALATVKGKQRCVKRCPKGQVKRTVNKRVRCVRRTPAPPRPQTPQQPQQPQTPQQPQPQTPQQPQAPPQEPQQPQTPPQQPQTPPHQADPVGEFRRRLAGSRLVRFSTSNTGSQGNYRYMFCADGQSFGYYDEYMSADSGMNYITQYGGTYTIDQAGFNADGTIGEALLSFTTNSTEKPQYKMIIRLVADNQAFTTEDGKTIHEWGRAPGQAGC
jgi:hypothetical protein